MFSPGTGFIGFSTLTVLASYDSGGTLNASYLTPGLDANLAMTQGGSTYYYMQDGLGSVRTIVDASENVQNTYDYRAFGINHGNSEGVTSPYRFTAREFETGGVLNLHYYRNRYYMPGVGIFTSRDAMWADVHRGWGYVRNFPTTYADPWGRGECKPGEKQCQAADTKAIPLGTGPDFYNATEDLLDGEAFDPVGEWVSDKACRSTDYEAKAEHGFAAYRVNDAGREMKWVRPLPSAVDTKIHPRLELTYRARGLRASDDGGCILWLGDSRKGNWGGFEAVMAREIVADGERHTVHVPLARFNPAGAINKVLIRVPSGKEGSAVLEVETLTFTRE